MGHLVVRRRTAGKPPAEVGLNGFHIRVGGRLFGGIS
jgi:hypothetical protein